MQDSADAGLSGAWPVTWAAARDDLLARMLAATPSQRLAWLEEALAVAVAVGALPTAATDEIARSRPHPDHGS